MKKLATTLVKHPHVCTHFINVDFHDTQPSLHCLGMLKIDTHNLEAVQYKRKTIESHITSLHYIITDLVKIIVVILYGGNTYKILCHHSNITIYGNIENTTLEDMTGDTQAMQAIL